MYKITLISGVQCSGSIYMCVCVCVHRCIYSEIITTINLVNIYTILLTCILTRGIKLDEMCTSMVAQ